MTHPFYFSKLQEPIEDGIEQVSEGLFVRLDQLIFKQYQPVPIVKVSAPDANFFTSPLFLHAWIVSQDGNQLKKETHCNLLEWMSARNYTQVNSFYWPPLDWGVIQKYEADVLLVVNANSKNYPENLCVEISSSAL